MLLIYLVAGWIVGILAAAWLKLDTPVWLVLGVLPIGYLVLFLRDRHLRTWHVVLLFLVLGALRYQLALPGPLDRELAQFNEQGRASLLGFVVADPDVRQTQTLVRVSATRIFSGDVWRDVHGLALVSVPRDTPVAYGDEVRVDGAPETPPNGADFSYRDYLARENIFTLISFARLNVVSSGNGDPFWTTLFEIRSAAKGAVNQLLPEPSAALLNGILLGDARGIPTALQDDFNNTNTTHIIAISGYNIAILVGVLVFVLRTPANLLLVRALGSKHSGMRLAVTTFLARHLVTILILVLLVLYTLLVGASASVVRAGIMGALVVIAIEVGRQNWTYASLAFAAFLMTLISPYVLWDVGFQLSFIATFGLVLYVPRMQARIEDWLKPRVSPSRARHVLNFLQDAVLVTAAAFLVTSPLLVVYFHRISLTGFVTNFLVLPVQPPIMVLGGAATFLQMLANALSPIPFLPLLPAALAQVLAWGAYVCLQYTILVVQATAALPFGSFELSQIDAPLVVLFYAALFGVTFIGVKQTARILVSQLWVGIALLALATIFVWTVVLASPDPRTHITFISSNEGDATFVRTSTDERILINGTGEPGTLLSFLGTQLPPWDRRLDLVIATHIDDDNLSSLNAVLERYNVGQVLAPPTPAHPGVSFTKWQELVEQKGIPSAVSQQGTKLNAGEATLDVIYAAVDSPDTALRLQTNGKQFLLAPVLRKADREKMIKERVLFDADVAVVPNDFEEEWFKPIAPETVILFVGRNPRAQPNAETLQLLAAVTVLRTDERGTITYSLDDGNMQVHADK